MSSSLRWICLQMHNIKQSLQLKPPFQSLTRTMHGFSRDLQLTYNGFGEHADYMRVTCIKRELGLCVRYKSASVITEEDESSNHVHLNDYITQSIRMSNHQHSMFILATGICIKHNASILLLMQPLPNLLFHYLIAKALKTRVY